MHWKRMLRIFRSHTGHGEDPISPPTIVQWFADFPSASVATPPSVFPSPSKRLHQCRRLIDEFGLHRARNRTEQTWRMRWWSLLSCAASLALPSCLLELWSACGAERARPETFHVEKDCFHVGLDLTATMLLRLRDTPGNATRVCEHVQSVVLAHHTKRHPHSNTHRRRSTHTHRRQRQLLARSFYRFWPNRFWPRLLLARFWILKMIQKGGRFLAQSRSCRFLAQPCRKVGP